MAVVDASVSRESGFSDVSPAKIDGSPRQDWIMSTQRREVRTTLAATICRMVARLGSRLLGSTGRAERGKVAFLSSPTQKLAASAENRTAPPEIPVRAATNSLRLDHRNQQPAGLCPARPFFGSPAPDSTTVKWTNPQSSLSCPTIHFPALSPRFRRTLPWAPAALCRRTERYDGKRDLHFQHAA
jgi:hypothetical protein